MTLKNDQVAISPTCWTVIDFNFEVIDFKILDTIQHVGDFATLSLLGGYTLFALILTLLQPNQNGGIDYIV